MSPPPRPDSSGRATASWRPATTMSAPSTSGSAHHRTERGVTLILYEGPRWGSTSPTMSDATTILVDTDLERDDAAAAATGLYLRLGGDGTISPVYEVEREPRLGVLDERLTQETGVCAIGLHANSRRWRDDEKGGSRMHEGGPENGIFCRDDGS